MNLPPPTPQPPRQQRPQSEPAGATPPRVATAPAPTGSTGALKVIGNILWFFLAGLWMAIAYVVAGIIMCITIIGIPFGIQSFKLAGYALWPFGRMVLQRTDRDPALSCLGNVLWFVLAGLWLAIGHLITGVLLCITIIGIPFGIASFKLAGLALVPFGKTVVKAGAPLPSDTTVYLIV
jgi:uncharacterized membrane protein YccF (DUF307 family)